jgi:hypothetical protein
MFAHSLWAHPSVGMTAPVNGQQYISADNLSPSYPLAYNNQDIMLE